MRAVTLISATAAAKRLGCSPSTITRWMDRGELPYTWVGTARARTRMIDPADLRGRKVPGRGRPMERSASEPPPRRATSPQRHERRGLKSDGTLVLQGTVTLPDGTSVEIPSARPSKDRSGGTPGVLLPEWEDFVGCIDDLPSDMSEQHDHYIHGTPKR